MNRQIVEHYSGKGDLVALLAASLERAGKDLQRLEAADLAAIDEFHIRGREATLELGRALGVGAGDRVLDIGSGLGGPARTLAASHGCRVTGIDLTPAYCDAANALSAWVGLDDLTRFEPGDATALAFADGAFDAAFTIHVAMNIAAKDRLYAEARRVLEPGGRFAIYDVLQGEGGEVTYPVPWARDASISHLATIDEMQALLTAADFDIVDVEDSTAASQAWYERMRERLAQAQSPPLSFAIFLGDDFPQMARNIHENLTARSLRTVRFDCIAT